MSFSVLGALLVLSLLAADLLLVAFPPRDAVVRPASGPWWLTALERVGQVGSIGLTVMAGPALARGLVGPWGWAVAACVALDLVCWGRYLTRGRTARLLLAPLGPVQIPLATFPVLAFLGAAAAAGSFALGLAGLALAIGHLGSTGLAERQARHSPDAETRSPGAASPP